MSDTARLAGKLQSYLQEKLDSSLKLCNFSSLSCGGGACQDNYRFDLIVDRGKYQGNHHLVLRTDKGGSLFASLAKQDEFAVTELAFSHGVTTPRPYWLEVQPEPTGNPFFIMQRIDGKANGRFVVKDRSLGQARQKLPDQLAQNLSQIHKIGPEDCSNEGLKTTLFGYHQTFDSYPHSTIQDLRQQLKQIDQPYPAIELCLNWAEANLPDQQQPVLVHGDFRTGNFMVDENGLTGILDWEFAHWGDPYEDISWLCLRDWRFGKNQLEAGGLCQRQEFYRLYQQYSGQKIDQQRVLFWEVIGNLRWAIGSIGQAKRHLSGIDRGIELAAIGRRTGEMEYEAMRLIENAG